MLHILVIDDEQMILDVLRQVLTRKSYTVQTAQSATEGIQKFLADDFDLVITDVCMPENDGTLVLDKIRRSSKGKTPVIGISGTPWMLKNDAFDLVLAKPFTMNTLIESVRVLIGNAMDADLHKKATSKKVANG